MIRYIFATLLCFHMCKFLTGQHNVASSHEKARIDDAESAETGLASDLQSGSKYFQDLYAAQISPEQIEFGHVCESPEQWEQRFETINLRSLERQGKVLQRDLFLHAYAHVPEKEHYEHGHKRGNEYHFTERHEKAHPHAGEFKTKVRWGDKHGGYGEHYWDFNHDGHDAHDGEESQPEPLYIEPEEASPGTNQRYRRQFRPDSNVEFVGKEGRQRAALSGHHGGNYRRHPRVERIRRQFGDEFSF